MDNHKFFEGRDYFRPCSEDCEQRSAFQQGRHRIV